ITPNTWVVWQTFLPKGLPGSVPDRPFKKDVAKAKALLAEAGFPNGFEVTLDHVSSPPWSDVAQALQADLGAVGIKVSLLGGEAARRSSTTQRPAPASTSSRSCRGGRIISTPTPTPRPGAQTPTTATPRS